MMVRETRAKAIRRAHCDGIEATGCYCQHECYDADSSSVGMTMRRNDSASEYIQRKFY